jgi:hypothetical protein
LNHETMGKYTAMAKPFLKCRQRRLVDNDLLFQRPDDLDEISGNQRGAADQSAIYILAGK